MLAAAWVGLFANLMVARQTLPDILQCQGQGLWHQFRGRLHRISAAPVASNREVAVVLGDVGLLLEDLRTELLADPKNTGNDCPLGQVALHLAQHLRTAESWTSAQAEESLAADLQVLQALGWNNMVRSGWPIFQLLYLLYRCMLQGPERRPDDLCMSSEGYGWRLQQRLLQRPAAEEMGLMAASWAFLASEEARRCTLLASAALLSIAWIRLPVYDTESEGLVRTAEARTSIWEMITAPAGHPLPFVAARLSAAYQLQIHLDAGKKAETEWEEPAEDHRCVVRFARTASGSCNFFAPIFQALEPWRARGGIYLEDQVRAFRPTTDQKTVLYRLIGEDLIQVIPEHSHLEVDFGATEPTCLAHAFLNLIAAVDLPDFDIVLNHGDLPLLRKEHSKPPFYGPMDKEARTPAPLFSICASEDFWDILFPNVCRPALVNMSGMSAIPWETKTPTAFWRGTDRGAVNWAVELRDMYRGSPRKRFLDAWSNEPNFDLAFLEDDLMNATVVNTDPSFVPLDKWPRWRYLLDLPGNGYSGSLKQKLTTTSAVLMMQSVNVAGAKPVYEHYHGGLQDGKHLLLVTMQNAGQKAAWAQQHDSQMKEMVENANLYMADVQRLTQCYLWLLIKRFASLLRYKPHRDQTLAFSSRASVRVMKVHRRPLRKQAAAFKKDCERRLAESEQ